MSIRVVKTAKMRARRWTAIVIVAAAALIFAPQAFAHDDAGPAASDTYVVGEGETLWSIAQSITPASGDVRDTIDTVKSMNMLDSANIRPGDQLLVPIYG